MSDLPVPVTVTSKLDTRFAQRGELRFQLQEDEPVGRGPRLGGTVNTSVGSPLDPKFSAELRKGSAQRPPQLTTAAEPKRSRMARICAQPSRPVGAATSAPASSVQGAESRLHRERASSRRRGALLLSA